MDTTILDAPTRNLVTVSQPFLDWVQGWMSQLPDLDLQAYLEGGIDPRQVAVISADLVEGFCYRGPLASERVAGIVPAAVSLFNRAHELGVTNFALVQEFHSHDAPEFDQFGPHCVRGTDEAETISPLKELQYADLFTVVLKNSLHPALHTDLDGWLAERPELNTFITVGDCTDLCLYQLVMHIKLNANAAGRRVTVLVPENCVQTYDLPISTAQQIGAMPHDGDLLHAIFLYHMALNGAVVVRSIT